MMKFFGLTLEDYIEENKAATVEVTSDNWLACMFFENLGHGNWNMGSGGPTGLRYESFREVRLAMGIKASDWPELFKEVRIMEEAALEEIYAEEED